MKKVFKNVIKPSAVFAAVFVIMLVVFGIFNCFGLAETVESLDKVTQYDSMSRTEKIEYAYSENFYMANYFRNATAVLYKLTGRRIMNDVYKDGGGNLINMSEIDTQKASYAEMRLSMSSALNLAAYCRDNGIPFLYVSYPYKTAAIDKLPPGVTDYSAENEDLRLSIYREYGFETLDLREAGTEINFYKTDHHWDVLSGFNVSCAVTEALKDRFGLELDSDGSLSDINNYYDYNFYGCFTGSEGIRVSSYFAEKDDFILYIPKFATDNYLALMDGKNVYKDVSGDFLKAYIEEALLYDPYYDNKFNSLLYGAKREAVMYNYLNETESNALLISDSYGCPVAPYLSLYFYELRYIDPSEHRYNGNFTAYMTETPPEAVILMYDGSVPNFNFGIYK